LKFVTLPMTVVFHRATASYFWRSARVGVAAAQSVRLTAAKAPVAASAFSTASGVGPLSAAHRRGTR
jgi:hypothetical protein